MLELKDFSPIQIPKKQAAYTNPYNAFPKEYLLFLFS